MSPRPFDPSRLDVVAFAKEGAELSGRWPLKRFHRVLAAEPAEWVLQESKEAQQALGSHDAGEVDWHARGEQRTRRAGEAQVRLHLQANAHVPLQCQRCLKPVIVPVEIQRSFVFVHGEDAAAQLDAESDDDVLAITRALDLRELIEDEILLALPIVPRHEVCPEPLVLPVSVASDADPADDGIEIAPHPFAALAGLKRGPLN